MDRKILYLSTAIYLGISTVMAQVTGTGTQSVPDLISHLLGININEPYQILGITATVGVLWVSTYVIFKVGIKRIDEGLDNDGYSDSGIANALGVDTENSRNLLAVLTLLVVLTMIGTGAFMGMIRGWQSLILLAFSFALLAGVIFVLIGGTGGIIGGTALVAGKSGKVTAQGVDELKDAADSFGDLSGSGGGTGTGDSGTGSSGGTGGPGPGDDSGNSGGSGGGTGTEINNLVEFVNSFDEVSRIFNSWERSAVERLESEISDVEPMDLESEDLRISFLVPSVGDRDSVGGMDAQRAYSLAALSLSLKYEDVYEALDSQRHEFTEKGREHAENIISSYETLVSMSEDSGLDFLDPEAGAIYFQPDEATGRPNIPEIVINYIPEELNSGTYPVFLRRMLETRSEENRDNPELESMEDKILHELTHYYIDRSTDFNMSQITNLDSGGKPYLDGINEAAAYCITYLVNPELESGQSGKVGFSSLYRKRSNIPASVMENSSKALFKVTEDLNGKERIEKIRELASQAINQAEEGNIGPVERIAEGELDEELKRAKKFNTARERANNYIADALNILDITDEKHSFPNSSSTKNLFSSDIERIQENIGALEEIEDDSGDINRLKNEFQELIEIYRTEERKFHKEYNLFEDDDVESNDLVLNYKAAFFGEFDWDKHIEERKEEYEELTGKLEQGMEKILSVLSKIHDEEQQEAQKIQAAGETQAEINQLIEDTKQAYKAAKKARENLDKARQTLENFESLGEKP